MTGHHRYCFFTDDKSTIAYGFGVIPKLVILCLGVWGCNVSAQAPEAPKPSDVRMVIDVSGSMKKNDPLNLRRPAVDMLIRLLPEGSKAGVWSFGKSVHTLVPHAIVDESWTQKANNVSSKINANAQFTHIGAALEQVAYDVATTNPDYQTHIILLTDGMVDISRDAEQNSQERLRIINDIMPRYQQAGFRLHTIALSQNADEQLLTRLALATDGRATVAKTAKELMNTFLQVFTQAVPAEEVPLADGHFLVDSNIEEFTALIFRQQGSTATEIISPDGTTYQQNQVDRYINWFHTDQYDLITVKQPLEGEWIISADIAPQSRITVVSDLRMVMNALPTNMAVDETLDIAMELREDNQTVTRVEFLGLLDIDAHVSSTNGTQWTQRISADLVPKDGVFHATLDQFAHEGEYIVRFSVDGKSFSRQTSHQLSVRKPFSVNVVTDLEAGGPRFIIKTIPQSQHINIERTVVIGDLQKPSGKSQFLPFSATADGHWELTVTPDEAGDHLLSVNVKAQYDHGETEDIVETTLKTVRLSKTNSTFSTVDPNSANTMNATPEPTAESVEIDQPDAVETEKVSQGLIYTFIAVINLLLITAGYFVYRKWFRKTDNDAPVNNDQEAAVIDVGTPDFVEPDMDDMTVDDIEESHILQTHENSELPEDDTLMSDNTDTTANAETVAEEEEIDTFSEEWEAENGIENTDDLIEEEEVVENTEDLVEEEDSVESSPDDMPKDD